MRFLLLLFLFPTIAYSQGQLELVFQDSQSQKVIADVYVKSGDLAWVSDATGKVTIKHNQFAISQEDVPLFISHISYNDTLIFRSLSEMKGSETLYLKRSSVDIPEAVVSTAPRVVYGHPEYHVADFHIDENGLVLLTYSSEKLIKRVEEKGRHFYTDCRLVWLNAQEDIVASTSVDGICESLYTGFPNELAVKKKTGYNWVVQQEDELFTMDLSENEFVHYVEPIKQRVDSTLIASNWMEDYPAFDYLYFGEKDSLARLLRSIEDEWLMKQFRAEYRWMSGRDKLNAYRAELETGIDKEVIAGFMTGFSSQMFYKPLYAPIFNVDEKVVIFDHHSDYIYHYSQVPTLEDSVEINYHKDKQSRFWEQKVLQDPVSNKFYLHYAKTGRTWLTEIDPLTGERGESFHIEHRYPESIHIYNDELLYVYRPFESSQTKHLYQQSLTSVKKGQGK